MLEMKVCLSVYTQSTGSSRAVQDITTCQKGWAVIRAVTSSAVTCYGTARLDQVDVRVLVTWGKRTKVPGSAPGFVSPLQRTEPMMRSLIR